jgi:hypothetical protein
LRGAFATGYARRALFVLTLERRSGLRAALLDAKKAKKFVMLRGKSTLHSKGLSLFGGIHESHDQAGKFLGLYST